MSPKKKHHLQQAPTPPPSQQEAAEDLKLTSKSLPWIGGGIATLILGAILLNFTDPAGSNLASTISPLSLTTGYVLIAIGLIRN
jgi:hypothetical protein